MGFASTTRYVSEARSGIRNTVMAPAATSAPAASWLIAPAFVASDVTATMMGSAVVQYSATVTRLCMDSSFLPRPTESATTMGTARISSSMTMNPTSSTGRAPTPARSIFAPDTTKNTGIKNP